MEELLRNGNDENRGRVCERLQDRLIKTKSIQSLEKHSSFLLCLTGSCPSMQILKSALQTSVATLNPTPVQGLPHVEENVCFSM